MEHIDRRTLLETAGASAVATVGAGVASADHATVEPDSPPVTGDLEVVSIFSGKVDRVGYAVDTDDPSTVEEIQAANLPNFDVLAEINGGIHPNAQWTSTSFTVPDLVDLLSAVDPKQDLVEYLEQLDIQQDIIEKYEFEEVKTQLVEFLEQLDADETQAAAIGELLNVFQTEFQIELPLGLSLGDVVEDILLNPESEIESLLELLSIENMEDLVNTIIGLVDGVDTIEGLEQYLVEFVSGLNFDTLFNILSIGLQVDELTGQFDPRLDDPALMTVDIETVTLLPEVNTVGVNDLPAIEVDVGVTLTTGDSGARTGTLTLDPEAGDGGEGQATAVDNEFTLDLPEFDLVDVVEQLDLVDLLETVFSVLEIDPAEYDLDIPQLVEDLDLPSLVENADIPGTIDDIITDEPGRHVVEADVDLSFGNLQAVLDMEADLPGEIPGGKGVPKDTNGDGLFEDVDGNGTFDIFDVQTLFSNLDSESVQNNPEAFGFNEEDGNVNIFDVQALFDRL